VTPPTGRTRRPTRARVSRDTILFAAGLAGIGYQQWTGSVSIPLLVLYGVMVGLPGVQALLQLMPGGQAQDPDPEPGPEPTPDDRTPGPSSRSRSRSSRR
jgi:hypothetical protein